MSTQRLFLDTVFIQALLNRNDQYHTQAQDLFPVVREASEVWTTEAVLIEVANALGGFHRRAAVEFIERCYRTPNIHVVSVDTILVRAALQLYAERPDKSWGLTDCISFVVMGEHHLIEAATADEHFIQAGYRALMSTSRR